MLGEHEVEDELFAPENDAFDDVEGQHAQTVQNAGTLVQQSCFGAPLANFCLRNDMTQFRDVGETTFARNYCSDRWQCGD